MQVFFIYLIVLNGIITFAQTPNPMDLFPYAVGNVWEYSGQWGGREEIYNDSVDQDGLVYLFYKYDDYYPPYTSFRIDSVQKLVYFTPYYLNWLLYKLDANLEDHWMVRPETSEVNRIEALVIGKESIISFGKTRILMEIRYFALNNGDTVISENSWPMFREVLLEGVGEIMYIDEEGGGLYKFLEGCIINGDTLGTITSVSENFISVNSFELLQNYPNPFNPTTTIKYEVPQISNVKIEVFDVLGRVIKVLVDEQKTTGHYEIKFDASSLASGIYYYRIKANEFVQTKKMMLIK